MKEMKVLCLMVALGCGYAPLCRAQETGKQDIIAAITAQAKETKSLECDFTQTKEMSMLGEKMVSQGRLSYQQPGKMRWEYVSPYRYTFVVDGQQVTIKKDEHTDHINAGESKVFKEITRIMMNCVLGKALTDERSFKVTMSQTAGEWVAALAPQTAELKRMFKTITLCFDKRTSVLVSVELTEHSGDRTVIEMKNVKTNVTIPASRFRVE